VTDLSNELSEVVQTHFANRTPLRIEGASTKSFLGRTVDADPLSTLRHRGITSFEPTELVMSARAGTPLVEVEQVLADAGQMLPFEPPRFGDGGTIGGAIATGLSGPRRPYTGSTRDFVLGVRMISGRGEVMRFGGEVMKNVAGYDVSRLMTGAQGTLGVILEISLKVLPRAAVEATRCLTMDAGSALTWMDQVGNEPYPISAMAHVGDVLYVRLSGTDAGVTAAAREIGGQPIIDDGWWDGLRDQTGEFFTAQRPLWRIAVPPGTPPLAIDGDILLDWGGTQRWLMSDADGAVIQQAAAKMGGHALRFRGGAGEPFQPLSDGVRTIHQRLKDAFDPHHILNPGRLYADL
jgi:glycolate oxidase FAD binding subunit